MINLPFFIVSDTHWGDRNIVKHTQRPKHHEDMMIARWRKTVKNNDVILHLGDLLGGGDDSYENFKQNVAPRLTGKKYIILGNHDKRRYDYEKDLGFKVIKPFNINYREYEISFNHYPKLLNENTDLKVLHVHGHIHNHPYSRNEVDRWGNVNVSVEVMNYYPRRITRVLNNVIAKRNQQNKQKQAS